MTPQFFRSSCRMRCHSANDRIDVRHRVAARPGDGHPFSLWLYLFQIKASNSLKFGDSSLQNHGAEFACKVTRHVTKSGNSPNTLSNQLGFCPTPDSPNFADVYPL